MHVQYSTKAGPGDVRVSIGGHGTSNPAAMWLIPAVEVAEEVEVEEVEEAEVCSHCKDCGESRREGGGREEPRSQPSPAQPSRAQPSAHLAALQT